MSFEIRSKTTILYTHLKIHVHARDVILIKIVAEHFILPSVCVRVHCIVWSFHADNNNNKSNCSLRSSVLALLKALTKTRKNTDGVQSTQSTNQPKCLPTVRFDWAKKKRKFITILYFILCFWFCVRVCLNEWDGACHIVTSVENIYDIMIVVDCWL